jgi:hypothetical protein
LLQEKFLVAICCKGCIVQLMDNCSLEWNLQSVNLCC